MLLGPITTNLLKQRRCKMFKERKKKKKPNKRGV
jgi:hypothetical protein